MRGISRLRAGDVSRDEQALGKHVFAKEVKKRKRSATPPEEITAGDEARYAEEERRVAKRADYDMDYQDNPRLYIDSRSKRGRL